MDAAPLDAEQGRLAWRCRRGMKELDLLLTGYLQGSLAAGSLRMKGPLSSAFSNCRTHCSRRISCSVKLHLTLIWRACWQYCAARLQDACRAAAAVATPSGTQGA